MNDNSIADTTVPGQESKLRRRNPFILWIGRVLIGLIVFFMALLVVGAVYQATATSQDVRQYPPPGQRVDVGGYKLHIYCTSKSSQGSPTVILDSQNGGTVSGWIWVQQEVGVATQVCAYDRAGLGWSDLSSQDQDIYQNAEALHTLLQKAGIPGPYILVGHSFGGLFVRGYADRYPDDVAGMVLIEATNPDFLKVEGKPDVMPGADPGMIQMGPWVARIGLLRLMPLFRVTGDLPEQQKAEINAYYMSAKYYETMKQQFDIFPTLLSQVRNTANLGSKPLVVVLGSKGDGGREVLQPLFEQQAALSSNSSIRMVEGAEHVNLVYRKEYAAQVSEAILDVVQAARSGEPLNPK